MNKTWYTNRVLIQLLAYKVKKALRQICIFFRTPMILAESAITFDKVGNMHTGF